MDRRDSKKNGSKQRQKDKSGKPKAVDEGEDDRKGKGGLVRTKFPCREIYRPPSMRKQRNNSSGNSNDLTNHNFSTVNSNSNNCRQTYPISPIVRPGPNNSSRTFNVHAKEFQYSQLDPQQQQQQQHSNYTQSQSNTFFSSNRHHQNNNGDYLVGNSSGLKSASILTSSRGCYPLQQSKSSGNVNNSENNHFYQLWHQQQQQQQQVVPPSDLQLTQRNQTLVESKKTSPTEPNDDIMYNSHNIHRHVPIQQSKSSGNISLRQSFGDNDKNGLRPSGSSNCGAKAVRFDFQDKCPTLPAKDTQKLVHDFRDFVEPRMDRFSSMKRDLEFTEQRFASLQIDGEAQTLVRRANSHHHQEDASAPKTINNVVSSPQSISKFRHLPTNNTSQPNPPLMLQKSRTTFYMDPDFCASGNNLGNSNYEIESQSKDGGRPNNLIRRSKSFGIVSKSNPQQQRQAPLLVPPPLSSAELATSPDFDLPIWPKAVQESIMFVMTTNTERVPVRNRIEMVTKIFSVVLREYPTPASQEERGDQKVNSNDNNSSSNEVSNVVVVGSDTDKIKDCEGSLEQTPKSNSDLAANKNKNSGDLISSAVNIFLYLIQREKDRTIMESVVNTCFATFQRLQKLSNSKTGANSLNFQESLKDKCNSSTSKWIAFLQFLSAMYTKIKVFRLQKSQQPVMKAFEEINFTLLSLLCDSFIVNLRSPLFQTSDTMDPLFNIMTSIGRDMEMLFPIKMKQILAAVRDALLGIRPFSVTAEAPSPNVQKTLMQLIELHAANWHLSSSAVRYYYYSNPD